MCGLARCFGVAALCVYTLRKIKCFECRVMMSYETLPYLSTAKSGSKPGMELTVLAPKTY